MKAVRDQGIDRDTAVMFSSDNGPETLAQRRGEGTGGLRRGKRSVWEGGARMPCIMRWPGHIPDVKPGIASMLDVFPTVLSSAGAPLPDDRAIDGHDLGPFLEGRTESPRSTLAFHRGATLFAVRSQNWKLHFWKMEPGRKGRCTRVARCNPEELYDLEGDPGETCNIAGDFPEVVKDLRQLGDYFRGSVTPGRLPPPRWRSVLPTWGKRERR